MGKEAVATAAEPNAKSRPECVNSSNPYHECSDYCLRKIAEARQRLDDEVPDSWKRPPEERTVHPDCVNASNPYHDCSEYCFKRIADAKAGTTSHLFPFNSFFVISFILFIVKLPYSALP